MCAAARVAFGSCGPLELDDGERETVDVQDEVEAAVALTVDHGHLADGAVRVRVRVLQVDEPDGRRVLGTERIGVRDGVDAVGEVAVRGPVLLVRVLGGRGRGGREGLSDRLRGRAGLSRSMASRRSE